jgi:hypothetical protein
MATQSSAPDLTAVHARLASILQSHRDDLALTTDSPTGVTLEAPGFEGKPRGYIAGTRLGKRYVSYYLMGVYTRPELVADVSPRLRARMQGKSCFNFTKVDRDLFEELEAVTTKAIEGQLAYIDEHREELAARR